jgi:hypothetical protein
MIIIWKNSGDPRYSGKEFELFRISWSDGADAWIRDERGDRWGIEHPTDGYIYPLNRPWSYYGELKFPKPDVSVPNLALGRPELNEVET